MILFQEFEIEKNKICCCSNIIVFTQANKKSLVTEICYKSKEISEDFQKWHSNFGTEKFFFIH